MYHFAGAFMVLDQHIYVGAEILGKPHPMTFKLRFTHWSAEETCLHVWRKVRHRVPAIDHVRIASSQ
jgi:hypothetical protein